MNDKLKIYNTFGFFPTPVSKFKLPSELHVHFNSLKQRPIKLPDATHSHLYSKENNILDIPEYKDLKKYITEAVSFFFNTILFLKGDIRITQSWLNKNNPGHFTHKHVHANSFVSGVLYFETNKQNGFITFHKSGSFNMIVDNTWTMKPVIQDEKNYPAENPYAYNYYNLPVENGDLILFPSYFCHSVPENKSNEDRWSLAFNSISNYIGDEDKLTQLICNEPSN